MKTIRVKERHNMNKVITSIPTYHQAIPVEMLDSILRENGYFMADEVEITKRAVEFFHGKGTVHEAGLETGTGNVYMLGTGHALWEGYMETSP